MENFRKIRYARPDFENTKGPKGPPDQRHVRGGSPALIRCFQLTGGGLLLAPSAPEDQNARTASAYSPLPGHSHDPWEFYHPPLTRFHPRAFLR